MLGLHGRLGIACPGIRGDRSPASWTKYNRMHVAFDLRYAADHFAGIGRHTGCLFEALLELPGPERYTVRWNPSLAITRFDLEPLRRHPRVNWVEKPFGPLSPASLWQVGAWLRDVRPSVYMSSFYFMPVAAGCPCVLMVHDVWPLRFGYGIEAWKRPMYRMLLRRARHARLVVTVSEFSRGEIVELAAFDAARLRVVHNGVPPQRASVAPRRPARVPERPFAFTIGLSYPYKNLPTLIDAWSLLGPDPPLELVAAGRELPRFPRVERLAAERSANHVTVLGPVDEAELLWLYRNATLLVFPSLYEGFGFPLVEAFAHGLPAVVSDIPVMRELDNGAARLVPPLDPVAWARAVTELAADAETRHTMRARGLQRAAQLSYRESARLTRDVLREAAGFVAAEAAA